MNGRRFIATCSLFAVTIFLVATPVQAQQRSTPKEAPPAPKVTKGSPKIVARFASTGWQVRCTTVGKKGKVACVLNQAIVEMRSRRTLVMLTIPGNRKAMTLRLPHGLDLRVPVVLGVDKQKLGKAVFVTSRPNGVYASFALGRDVLGKMQKGKTLHVRMQILRGRAMNVRLDLQGFGNALKKLAQ